MKKRQIPLRVGDFAIYVGSTQYKHNNYVLIQNKEGKSFKCWSFMGLQSWFYCERKDLKPVRGADAKKIKLYIQKVKEEADELDKYVQDIRTQW